MTNVHDKRTCKDVLFRMIFSGKQELPQRFGTINGSAYDCPKDLTITTINGSERQIPANSSIRIKDKIYE